MTHDDRHEIEQRGGAEAWICSCGAAGWTTKGSEIHLKEIKKREMPEKAVDEAWERNR